jgi:predicted esterase
MSADADMSSDDIRFFCGNRRCGALITVEFGCLDKYVACDACGEEARVPRTARRRIVSIPQKKVASKSSPVTSPVIEYAAGPTLMERLAMWSREPMSFPAGRRMAQIFIAVPVGLWFLCCSVAVLGTLWVRAQPDLPANLDQIIDEIASVKEIYQAPSSNSDGSRLAWIETADNALALYFADFERNHTNHVDEWANTHLYGTSTYHKLLDWSPDDRYFAYTRHSRLPSNEAELILVDGRSGEERFKTKLPTYLRHFAWMTASTAALLDSTNRLHTVLLDSSGLRITSSRPLPLDDEIGAQRQLNHRRKPAATGFVRMDAKSIAYVRNGNLYQLDLSTDKSIPLSAFKESLDFEWLEYHEASHRFLFCNRSEEQPFLRRAYIYTPKGEGEGTLETLPLERGGAIKASWINEGKGVATLVNAGPIGHLNVVPDLRVSDAEQRHFEQGTIRAFTASPSGNSLFVVGATGPEPHAIWKCQAVDKSDKSVETVVPTTPVPFQAAQLVPPLPMTVKDAKGKPVSFYLIPPINLERGKQYPLVIDGPNQGRWTHHGQFFANIGCYYAAVNRRGLFSSDQLHDAAEDILTTHAHLVAKPSIDATRVYLIGFSAATRVVAELAISHPQLWRGLVMNNPVTLPRHSPSTSYFPRLLLSIGNAEAISEMAAEFASQDHQIQTFLKIHDKAGHTFRGTRLQAERLRLYTRHLLIRGGS